MKRLHVRPKRKNVQNSKKPSSLPDLCRFFDPLGAFFLWKLEREMSAWTAYGEAPFDNFGMKVASAGDVNGDGYADVAIWASGQGQEAGKVYIYLGSPKGLSRTPAWAVGGSSPRTNSATASGLSVTSTGTALGISSWAPKATTRPVWRMPARLTFIWGPPKA